MCHNALHVLLVNGVPEAQQCQLIVRLVRTTTEIFCCVKIVFQVIIAQKVEVQFTQYLVVWGTIQMLEPAFALCVKKDIIVAKTHRLTQT